MKHLLSLESLSRDDMDRILGDVPAFKGERVRTARHPLAGQTWALIFSKSSTRTRVSFEVGIRELGGNALFLNANDIQLGRGEPIKDTARVLGRMVQGAVIRTYAQNDVVEFARYSGIPTVNALTDDEHPCQILTDIFTYIEKRGPIQGKTVALIGDGACNVPASWIFAAARLGFELRIAAPTEYQPAKELVHRAGATAIGGWTGYAGGRWDAKLSDHGGHLTVTSDVGVAAKDADLIYTDVWISMGKESESEKRIRDLAGYQINDAVVKLAKPDALVMHCLPAYRGKEIDEVTFEAHAQTIFDQAENRLHVQKSILNWLAS
jgi:ornithine carbamoyltransferase